MSTNIHSVDEAHAYLQAMAALLQRTFASGRDDEELWSRIERQFRLLPEPERVMVKTALGDWLNGEREEQFVLALDCVGLWGVTEYLDDVDRIGAQIRSGQARWSRLWLTKADAVSLRLRDALHRQPAS